MKKIAIRISGGQMSPETINTKDALEFALGYLDGLEKTAQESDGDSLSFSGLFVERGSAQIIAFPSNSTVAHSAVGCLAKKIKDPTYNEKEVVRIRKSAKKFLSSNHAISIEIENESVPVNTPEKSSVGKLSEFRSSRATVVQVGGDTSPHVKVRDELSGELLSLKVKKNQARELGGLLYETIELDAEIEFDEELCPHSGKLIDFFKVSDSKTSLEDVEAWFSKNCKKFESVADFLKTERGREDP